MDVYQSLQLATPRGSSSSSNIQCDQLRYHERCQLPVM
jgi:hypothetical protein